jgi:hypothetical protein
MTTYQDGNEGEFWDDNPRGGKRVKYQGEGDNDEKYGDDDESGGNFADNGNLTSLINEVIRNRLQ